jgi:hypothetical protein
MVVKVRGGKNTCPRCIASGFPKHVHQVTLKFTAILAVPMLEVNLKRTIHEGQL